MLWKEVKSWAKKHGYESSKNEGSYSWFKINEPEKSGCEKSVSKLATAIFNDMTDNKWVEHQKNYGIS
jgi:hypothetical protein